jgi:uncharacterized protein YodC (DUF2158 family)
MKLRNQPISAFIMTIAHALQAETYPKMSGDPVKAAIVAVMTASKKAIEGTKHLHRRTSYMADEIKAGDIVQLKSGGPEMTVEKLEPWNGVQTAWCQWFDKGQGLPQASRFPLTSLRVIEQ